MEIKQFTDEKLNQVWQNADFGASSKRNVILHTLSATAQGFSAGNTSTAICSELGLISGMGSAKYLTELGLEVLLTNSKRVPVDLSFNEFRKANLKRCLKWHPEGINSWSYSEWLTAVAGELGELAGLIKMKNRERDGLPGNKFSPTKKNIADEIADVFTYLDILAECFDINLGQAAVEKFNEVSERVGFPDRIDPE